MDRLRICYQNLRPIVLATLSCVCFISVHSQPQSQPIHPRGLISTSELSEIRQRLTKEPYATFFRRLKDETQVLSAIAPDDRDAYQQAYLAAHQATLFILTEQQIWADKAWETIQLILQDPYFTDPISRGLTRALVLKQVAITYDFAWQGWDTYQRKIVSKALYDAIFSVNANMGYSANYNLVSNWMGVRYGSVVLAALVWDDLSEEEHKRSPVLPILWDSIHRLEDHISANLFEGGWNAESMGYHSYNWSFIGPALVAFANQHSDRKSPLSDLAPEALNSMKGISISEVATEPNVGSGYKADLSDDNLSPSPAHLYALAFRLYPDSMLPAIKWGFDYRFAPEGITYNRNSLIYSLLYYPDTVNAQNPSKSDSLTFHDPEQGILIIRNRFKDSLDIVTTINATQHRIKGHNGPDANSIRLIGMGVPWIIGGGRTGLTAGQSQFFPSESATAANNNRHTGKLHHHEISSSVAYAHLSGNNVGTQSHRRHVWVTYDSTTHAAATIVVLDSSTNGQRWRINTPEFNHIAPQQWGYLLTAPNGATLQVSVINSPTPLNLSQGSQRYGGNTQQHNSGIYYKGTYYTHSKWIDSYCDRYIGVVITLQPPGKVHPNISYEADLLKVGDFVLHLK